MKKILILSVLLGLAASLPALAAPADEVKALLDQRNAAAAYALAKQHPGEIGNPAFDFYFGIAAIDSGHAGEGVLALERYVINFPNNLEARLELARGYYVLGEDSRAREEFREVLKANPPPDVAANIERFMNALDARQSSYRTTTGVYAEFGLGHDSNVNGGIGSAGIVVPSLGNVRVDVSATGVKAPADFSWFAAGAEINHPVAPGLMVFANGRLDGKYNGGGLPSQFDQQNVVLNGGLTYLQDKNLYRATITHATVEVDSKRFRDVDALTGELHHQLDELQTVGPFLQAARFTYTGENEVRDSDFYVAGVNYRKAFIAPFQPLLTVTASVANENMRRDVRSDLGRDIYGGRAALAITPAPKWSAAAGISYQKSKYSGIDPNFLAVRKDDYFAIDATVGYAFSRSWSLRGEVILIDNQSNLPLYEYKRNVVDVKLRYDF